MSSPHNASTSPASAGTWPPPPTSAPETFKIERLTIIINGDHLRVEDASNEWGWLMSPIAYLLVVGLLRSEEVYLSWRHHYLSFIRPAHHLWVYQSLHHYLVLQILLLFGSSALVGLMSWGTQLYRGQSISLFSRLTNTVSRGRKSGQIVSVGVPHALRDKSPHYVKCLSDWTVSSDFKGVSLFFTFLERENAVRFGQVLADFLGVPVVEV